MEDHYCIQEAKIVEMHKAITGNGNPQTGLLFIANRNIDHIAAIKDDIAEIKSDIKSLAQMYDTTFDAASTAASAVERYKAESQQYEAGKEAVRVQRNLTLTKIVQIIGVIIALGMFILGYKNMTRQNTVLKTEIQTLIDTAKKK